MKTKRIITLLLAIITLSAILASCAIAPPANETDTTVADNPTDVTTGNATDTTAVETEVSDDLPATDMEKYKFRIASYTNDFTHGNTVIDKQSGDVLEDAIYSSILSIEERFNVDITETISPSSYVNQESKVWVKAQEDVYDILIILDRDALTWASEGLAVRYDNLPEIDMTKPYWDQSINKSVSICNNYFMAAGAANLTVYDYTHMLIFNKELVETLNLESPYSCVDNNNWTYETFNTMMSAALFDVDGNGVTDGNDRCGVIMPGKQVLPNMWIAAGELSVEKDNDDVPYFNVAEDMKFQDVIEDVMDMMWDGDCWYTAVSTSNSWFMEDRTFENGNALFAGHTFFTAGYVRTITDNFGIVPYPKYDAQQSDYYSRVEGGIRMMVVPVTNKDLTRTSIIMEAMHCEAYKNQIPAYYDVVLKGKTASDEKAAVMLDTILANRVYDLGDSYWYSAIRSDVFTNIFLNNSRTLSSGLSTRSVSINKVIQLAIKNFK